MAQRKRRVNITLAIPGCLIHLDATREAVEEIRRIEGVVELIGFHPNDPHYSVRVSTLYDLNDIVTEIEALNEEIPEPFLET